MELSEESFAAPLKAWAEAVVTGETPEACDKQEEQARATVGESVNEFPQIKAQIEKMAVDALQARKYEMAHQKRKAFLHRVDLVAEELHKPGTVTLTPEIVQALNRMLDDPWATETLKSMMLERLRPEFDAWTTNLLRSDQGPDCIRRALASLNELQPDIRKLVNQSAVSRLLISRSNAVSQASRSNAVSQASRSNAVSQASRSNAVSQASRSNAASISQANHRYAERIIEQYLSWTPAPSAYPPAVGHPEPPPADLGALIDRCRSLNSLSERERAALRDEIENWRGEREGTVLHWAASHAMGVEVVDAIAPLFEDEKDRRLVENRQHHCDRQNSESEFRYKYRGGFGRLSLVVDADRRLPLSRATHPEVVQAMCRHGADPCDDGYTWSYDPPGFGTTDMTGPREGIYPAICYVQHPAVFEALVDEMGAEVEITPYQLEKAATPLAIRLMCERYPSVLNWVTEAGGHASLKPPSFSIRPDSAGIPVSHYANPALTKTLLVCLREHLELPQDDTTRSGGVDHMRTIIDRGTMKCDALGGDNCYSMPLRCPSLESAKMLCAWRCVHAKDDADWRQWSKKLKRELDDRHAVKVYFGIGRTALKSFLDRLTATRPALAGILDV